MVRKQAILPRTNQLSNKTERRVEKFVKQEKIVCKTPTMTNMSGEYNLVSFHGVQFKIDVLTVLYYYIVLPLASGCRDVCHISGFIL